MNFQKINSLIILHNFYDMKKETDKENLDHNWYYAMEEKEGDIKVLHCKELFAGYTIMRLKTMLIEFED